MREAYIVGAIKRIYRNLIFIEEEIIERVKMENEE
jgi:hypothetical protein